MNTSYSHAFRTLCALLPLVFTACAGPEAASDESEGADAGERSSAICGTWPRCPPPDDDEPTPEPPPRANLRARIVNGQPNDPASPYCAYEAQAWFIVENIGEAAAGATIVRFEDFDGPQYFAVPPLGLNQASQLFILSFDRNHPGDSWFVIQADASHLVLESTESDNTTAGSCFG